MLDLAEIKEKITPILEKYGIRYAGVFGSYARGDARPDSDIDILVSIGDKPISLWDFVSLRDELQESIGKRVDVISDKAIIPYFKDYIYRDLKPLYGSQ